MRLICLKDGHYYELKDLMQLKQCLFCNHIKESY